MWLGAVRKWNEKVRNLWYPLGVENQVQHANISTFFRVESSKVWSCFFSLALDCSPKDQGLFCGAWQRGSNQNMLLLCWQPNDAVWSNWLDCWEVADLLAAYLDLLNSLPSYRQQYRRYQSSFLGRAFLCLTLGPGGNCNRFISLMVSYSDMYMRVD